MNTRAHGEGVTQVLIMCDQEGNLGDPDNAKRQTAVENHYKWVEAAKTLGCHAIRVNGYSSGSPDEQMKLVADGMRKLVEFADKLAINVVIENHGGLSSNAKWLVQTIKLVNHPRAGTLPDFGNFRIAGPSRTNPDTKVESYDSYVGVAEMMPLAKGVSVKPVVWDAKGNSTDIDLHRMMKIVVGRLPRPCGHRARRRRQRAREHQGTAPAARNGARSTDRCSFESLSPSMGSGPIHERTEARSAVRSCGRQSWPESTGSP